MQKGNWLQSQETACREFARIKNIEITQSFSDGWVSGKYTSREALDKMIAYLKSENKNYSKISYVIVDDIDRISRNVVWRWYIKESIESSGAKIHSLKQTLEDSPEWTLQQNILMSMKQYDRENNARRVRDRQRARMLDGYWPLYPPQGYKHTTWDNGRKVLELVEPDASIIKEGLELFAAGVFATKEALRDHFIEQRLITRRKKKLPRSFIDRLLTEHSLLFYAWFIDYKPWDVSMSKGQHSSIIDKATVSRILERLNPKVLYKKYSYNEIDEQMPLRWVVHCEACGHPLTGWPSQNHQKKTYFYYSCRQKTCTVYGKSFSEKKVQAAFDSLLATLKIRKSVISLLEKVCNKFYADTIDNIKKSNSETLKDIKVIETAIDQLLDRIDWTKDDKVIALYEKRLRELIDKKQHLEDQGGVTEEKTGIDPLKLLNETKTFLENPWKIWKGADIEVKRLFTKVLFRDNITYWKISGLWTSDIPLIYKPFSLFRLVDFDHLEVMGFEPMSESHVI